MRIILKKKKCKCERKRSHLAYGQKYDRGNWCRLCDCGFAPDINKKRARQKGKKVISSAIKDWKRR
jgi:hypothetical protein